MHFLHPYRLGNLEVKNHLVRSATSERLAAPEGSCGDELISYLSALARGGVGVIITGHAYVHPAGKVNPRMTAADADKLVAGLSRLAREVHRYDTRIVLQINHAGARTCSRITGLAPVAPSSRPSIDPEEQARQLSLTEIQGLVECYARAAWRAREAGFDAVQVHAAHGFLISQFLTPRCNRREDEYGGSLENRSRFLLAVCRAIRREVGPEFPVWVKINCADYHDEGLTVEESVKVCRWLEREEIDLIELSGGTHFTVPEKGACRSPVSKPDEEAYFLPEAEKIREAVGVPVVLVGGIRTVEKIEFLLEEKRFDLVAMSRPFLRTFEVLTELGKKGRVSCMSCSRCLSTRRRPPGCAAREKIVIP